ncbi:hypothetical protein ACFUYE_07700, partial [Micromonospora humida]|uniref:hypothetical protein n=1 Tax=Micromonospora humida TaxID=2809018 RepID=UPI0036730179
VAGEGRVGVAERAGVAGRRRGGLGRPCRSGPAAGPGLVVVIRDRPVTTTSPDGAIRTGCGWWRW